MVLLAKAIVSLPTARRPRAAQDKSVAGQAISACRFGQPAVRHQPDTKRMVRRRNLAEWTPSPIQVSWLERVMQQLAILMVSLMISIFIVRSLKAIVAVIVVGLLALAIYGFITLLSQFSGA